ncbi:MAG: phosphotransferase [Corynebacteriales bacterium]|nr:phosphotransferase [Mycobacteriales bacterium]
MALEERWTLVGAGATLVHADLRADNILIAPPGVTLVDWPWASYGAPWLDFF